ncbi:BRO family protein [Methylocystis sp.]|uniref:BRO-N domain-containing protein n=1 Tax=Methylocystis sp. TaxID=1911079 RepID=UPI0025EB0CD2|nr:BRO family protein [Methylocystis sp.]
MSEDQINANGENKASLPVEFKFRDHPVRAFKIDDEIWTVANDACAALDLKNPNQVLTRLDDDEKGVRKVDTLGGPQELAVVNLSGLVRLITRSNKPEARAFQRWLFHDVVPSIYKTGRYEVGQGQAEPNETADPESARDARDRLLEIFAVGSLNFDHLLKALFGKNIPYTSSRRYPLFLTECCDALGVPEATAAGRIPDSQMTTLVVEAGEERLEKRAIAEAALIFLAFARQTLAPNQIGSEEGHKNAEDWVQIPKCNVGRFILTILPNGSHHLYRSDCSHVLYEADQMNCLAISHSLKTVEAFWRRCQQILEFGGDLRGSQPLLALDGAIANAAQHANHFIKVYTRLGDSPRFDDPRPMPRTSRQPTGNGQSR